MRIPGELKAQHPSPTVGVEPTGSQTAAKPASQALSVPLLPSQFKKGDEARLSGRSGSGGGAQALEASVRTWTGQASVDQRASSFAQVLMGGVPPSFKDVAEYSSWSVKDSFKLSGPELETFRAQVGETTQRISKALDFVNRYAGTQAPAPASSSKVEQQAHSFAQGLLGGVPPSFTGLEDYAGWAIRGSFGLKPNTPEISQFKAQLTQIHDRLVSAKQQLDSEG